MGHTTSFEAIARDRGAIYGDDAGVRVAVSYGDTVSEYGALQNGAVLVDLPHWGLFTLSGKNSIKFLQGLVTNDVASLGVGTGCFAAFLNVNGRIEAVVDIFRVGESELVLVTPPEATEWVARSLGRFRAAGGFDLVEVVDSRTAVVAGPQAREALERALAIELPEAITGTVASASHEGERLYVLGVWRAGVWSADVSGSSDAVARLGEALLAAGVEIAGVDALELARLDAGIARFAVDYDSDTVLQEADLPNVVSYTKGCYLGQEIVARLHYQGQPAKLVRGLRIAGDELPPPGSDVVAGERGEKVAGRVTSARRVPRRGCVVFATIKRKFYEIGTGVSVRVGERLVPATVAARAASDEAEERQ